MTQIGYRYVTQIGSRYVTRTAASPVCPLYFALAQVDRFKAGATDLSCASTDLMTRSGSAAGRACRTGGSEAGCSRQACRLLPAVTEGLLAPSQRACSRAVTSGDPARETPLFTRNND